MKYIKKRKFKQHWKLEKVSTVEHHGLDDDIGVFQQGTEGWFTQIVVKRLKKYLRWNILPCQIKSEQKSQSINDVHSTYIFWFLI